MAKSIYTENGVEFGHVARGKWFFKGIGKDGQPFEKRDIINGVENARQVARQIGGSLKVVTGAVGITVLARNNIAKILAPSSHLYRGINFQRCGDTYN